MIADCRACACLTQKGVSKLFAEDSHLYKPDSVSAAPTALRGRSALRVSELCNLKVESGVLL